jgi:hypothetical protein
MRNRRLQTHGLRTRRARLKQRGAIFVEALTVIGLMITCMQCIWWMYEYCLFKHKAVVESRAKAWETALKGCSDPDVGGALGGLKNGTGDDVGGIGKDSDSAPGWFGIPQASPSKVSLDLPEEVFGEGTVVSEQHFSCNEKGGHKELELGGGSPNTDDLTQTN